MDLYLIDMDLHFIDTDLYLLDAMQKEYHFPKVGEEVGQKPDKDLWGWGKAEKWYYDSKNSSAMNYLKTTKFHITANKIHKTNYFKLAQYALQDRNF